VAGASNLESDGGSVTFGGLGKIWLSDYGLS